jgi:Holliday junction resolvase RusA-like endonuclease
MMLFVSLIQCPNCGNQYSADNDACTHCYVQAILTGVKPKRSKKPKQDEPRRLVFYPVPSLSAIVAGQPRPKERARVANGHAYTPKATKEYKELIQASLSPYIKTPFTGLLYVELEFCRQTYVLADVDNLTKAIFDAANKLLWNDDKQVRRLLSDVTYGHEKPCVKIRVYEQV